MAVRTITEMPVVTSQAGAPATTPDKVGDINVDTTALDIYVATGVSSAADWHKLTDQEIATLTTADATPTAILTKAATATTTSFVDAVLSAMNSDGSIAYVSKTRVAFDADGLIGTAVREQFKKGTTATIEEAWTVAAGDLTLTVTGIAATTLHWKLFYLISENTY